MTKLETKLAVPWVSQLRRECSERKEKIKIIKIHGGPYQTLGISDYLGWYKDVGFGMEMKVHPNTLDSVQEEFLKDIIGTGNIGICITFSKGCYRLNPHKVLTAAYFDCFRGNIYHCVVGY